MQINRKQLYIRYRAIRRKLNYTHLQAVKALASFYHVQPSTIVFELISYPRHKQEEEEEEEDGTADRVLYAVMTENPFNVY